MDRLRSSWRRRRLRVAIMIAAGFIAGLEWGALIFHASCRDGGEPDAAYEPPQVRSFIEEFPDYKRTEESTYLTLPEWYEVFSYQEYADTIRTQRPSSFRSFAAIGQFWDMYCRAYGATDGRYPFNAGNHLVIGVIGVSFTAEYAVKGSYENTVGRLYELSSHTTPEDAYAATVATDYGEFVETRPWYEFPFGRRAIGLWTENDLVGPHFLRKCERKVFLTYEYTIKAAYAGGIRLATKAIFGPPPALDYLWVANLSADQSSIDGLDVVRTLDDGTSLVTLPHYQAFTDGVPALVQQGTMILDVAGNDRIVLTAIAPDGWTYEGTNGKVVWQQDVLTDPPAQRVVMEVSVRDLHHVLPDLRAQGVRMEHLFDY